MGTWVTSAFDCDWPQGLESDQKRGGTFRGIRKARKDVEVLGSSLHLFVCLMLCVSVHLYMFHVQASCCLWNSNRASGPLELEVQMVVSHHVGAGNQTRVA